MIHGLKSIEGCENNLETKEWLENIGDYIKSDVQEAYENSRQSYLEFLKDPKKHFARMKEAKNNGISYNPKEVY